uniref:(northern house mosquito) hypothetical protein n=1 Tax=Culex pipiens TaxID=7175 RepID=A0A8D8AIX4_CULPI
MVRTVIVQYLDRGILPGYSFHDLQCHACFDVDRIAIIVLLQLDAFHGDQLGLEIRQAHGIVGRHLAFGSPSIICATTAYDRRDSTVILSVRVCVCLLLYANKTN